ncbi:p-hydroxycinnamoyl CoA hydratase/lyase [Pigmentiphaga soli]|uniref:p-hydroxycinnamoyl CoA hydratase/lyase n=1 Tax=Pigmentiphaga soli TaxID=1007095 RepID=A0ABP8GSX3_9BURK
MNSGYSYENVKVDVDDGVAWVRLNRPEKRNAMSPRLNHDMVDVLSRLETDTGVGVVVLGGEGQGWTAGMDLELFFRDLDDKPAERAVAHRESQQWRWNHLYTFPKPTIAMVHGFCYGGGFTQLIACDFAIAAEDTVFGLSEVNWGIIPAGIVAKALMDCVPYRDALDLCMTGRPIDGTEAERMRLITRAVPGDRLRAETEQLARRLLKINPEALRGTKQALKITRGMSYDQSIDYLAAKFAEQKYRDAEGGYAKGIAQFIDDKSYRPAHGPYSR